MSLLGLALLAASAPPAEAEVEHDPPPPGAVARIGSTRLRVDGTVYLSADGKEAIEAGETVRVIDPATGKRVATIPVPGADRANGLAYDSKTGRLTLFGSTGSVPPAAGDGLTLWTVDVPGRKVVGKPVTLPPTGEDRRWRWDASPDGSRVVVGGTKSVRVYDGRTGDELAALDSTGWPGAVLPLPGGSALVCFQTGPTAVYVWDWQKGDAPRKLVAPAPGTVPASSQVAAAGPDGRVFLGCGPRVLVYDIKTGGQVAVIEVGASIRALAVRPDGKAVAVVPEAQKPGNGVTVWDVATGKPVRSVAAGRGYAQSVTWSADGSRLAAVATGRLWVWDAATGEPVTPPVGGHDGYVDTMALAADGRLVTGGWDATVRVWDPRTGQPGPPLTMSAMVEAVAVSPDGGLIAASSGRNDLRVWDGKTGGLKYLLLGNGRLGGAEVAGFTPDGKRLVTWGRMLRLRTWDMATGKLLAEYPTFPGAEAIWEESDAGESDKTCRPGTYALSPDASRFAVAITGAIRVYDTATGKELPRLELPPGGVSRLALSPDGNRLLVAGEGEWGPIKKPDGTEDRAQAQTHPVQVWDLEAEKVLWEATDAGTGAGTVVFTPDGRSLLESDVVAGEGPVIRWRDAATGKVGGRMKVAPGGPRAFDPAGKRVAVPLGDGTVAVYDLVEGKPGK